jgi:hypothetical protein
MSFMRSSVAFGTVANMAQGKVALRHDADSRREYEGTRLGCINCSLEHEGVCVWFSRIAPRYNCRYGRGRDTESGRREQYTDAVGLFTHDEPPSRNDPSQ